MTEFIGGEVKSDAVLDVLGKIVQLGGNTEPAMRQIAGYMENEVRLGFKFSRTPWGEPWAPIKHRQGQPLIDSRTLLGSINSAYGADFAEVGTNSEYAGIHQFGGYTGKNKTAKIPARAYLPIEGDEVSLPDHWEGEILGILAKVLDGISNG